MSNQNISENNKVCKFFKSENGCRHGDKCRFSHDNNNIKKSSFRSRPKNTESFVPSFKSADMNVYVDIPSNKKYDVNDVIIIPNFLNETIEKEIYNKLLNEINESGIDKDKLWKLWHGDTHLIADDHLNWKEKVPTFQYILDQITTQFNIIIRSSRFNLYKDSSDWKPFHHDAAAIKEHIAEIQNFTVGISLGATRDIAFEHSKTKSTVSFKLPNCTAYAFSKNVNINWKHGIPKIHPDKAFEEGRISIIAWAQCNEI
jgi:hypothetical protein